MGPLQNVSIGKVSNATYTPMYRSDSFPSSPYRRLVGINAAEGDMRSYVEALEGEEMIQEYQTLYKASILPNFLRPLLCRFLLDKRRAHLVGNAQSGGLQVHQLWDHAADLLELRHTWSDAFKEAGIDAIIFPGYPLPAVPHGMTEKLTMAASYMFIPNLLLWPSGVVPVTTVQEDEQHYRMQDLPRDQQDEIARIAAETMKDSVGMPIAVSIMTPSFQDEKCLRVMKEVERVVKFKAEPTVYKNR
jgi:fatty acid amide hydrolase